MRSGRKSALTESLVSQYPLLDVQPNVKLWPCVLDGGYLLQAVDWKKGSTYIDIINCYHSFIKRYGEKIIVVFDGYLNSNTKDLTHEKRYPIKSLRIKIDDDMKSDCRKELFLSNPENKQDFINILGQKLRSFGYTVIHHENDADVLIAEKVVELAKDQNIRVVCDDTDVFMLLLAKLDKTNEFLVYLKQPKVFGCLCVRFGLVFK